MPSKVSLMILLFFKKSLEVVANHCLHDRSDLVTYAFCLHSRAIHMARKGVETQNSSYFEIFVEKVCRNFDQWLDSP